MTKISAVILTATLIFAVMAGCTGEMPSVENENPQTQTIESSTVTQPEESEESSEIGKETDENQELTPIYGSQIKDGTYDIEVTSSSSMFKVVEALLSVENGDMWAVLTLSGKGYEKLYMGTGLQAQEDSDENCIYYEEDSQGRYTYKVPVTALDKEIDVAAWSIKKETWYDRVLVFKSGDILGGAADVKELEDGEYTAEVELSGGSGKSKVESPAAIRITSSAATATIAWSSPHYEHMVVDGEYYYPVNTQGNSTFVIPVKLDKNMEIKAQTIAMGTPHEIDYILYFDSSTITPYSN